MSSRTVRRLDGSRSTIEIASNFGSFDNSGRADLTVEPSNRPVCNRCGFEVRPRAWGCKNPCANCGTVYPLGDCSD